MQKHLQYTLYQIQTSHTYINAIFPKFERILLKESIYDIELPKTLRIDVNMFQQV